MTVSDSNLGQMFQEALAHHQAGHLVEAERGYRQILAQQPQHAEAWHLLGALAAQVGRQEVAVELIRRALAIEPNYPTALSNLGKILRDMGRYDEAIAACRQAIALDPNFAEAYSKLGVALRDQGLLEEAVAAFRQAMALEPKDPEPYCNLGVALKDQGQLEEAIAAYRQALALNPNIAEAHFNLGNELRDAGQLDEAIAAYRRALALRPNYPEAHSNLIYTLYFHPDWDNRSIAGELAQWNRQFAEPLQKFIQPHGNNRDPERRLRIGYVSADFKGHSSALFLDPLLRAHDRKTVEVFCYAEVAKPDVLTQRMQSLCEGWRSTVGESDEAVAEQVRRDGIDILVDLKLHTSRNRLLTFARKPAPVQVTWLGYPGSTGLTTIDYRLSDPYLDPPGMDESVYSERVYRLPDCFWCFDPLDERDVPVNSLPALQTGAVTFGCLNAFLKINEETLALWAQVLRAVKGSRLMLLVPVEAYRQRVLDVLTREGIAPERVEFPGRMSHRDYIKKYHQMDIGLDCYPCNGHTTTLESLWMGVPVVTRVGRTGMGRAGWSELSNVGLQELAGQNWLRTCRGCGSCGRVCGSGWRLRR
jgi:predicted O-linked N-acetylglucosamine transferase (SPINDLY family)